MGSQVRELLESALARLRDTGIAVESDESQVELRWNGHTYQYTFEVKTRITPASAQLLQPSPGRRRLLVAAHVSDNAGDMLRARDVDYVDSVGNMSLRGEGLLVDVRGRRAPASRPGVSDQPLRAFKPSGLKVVFGLLADPDLMSRPYREIVRSSGTSLSTVHWVLNELEVAGYATIAPRRLYRTRNLLDRWVEAYTLNLWPPLLLARFDAPDPSWWTTADDALRAAGAQWGGETAAHRINPRLRPKRTVIYAPDIPTKLAAEFRFRRSEGEGEVEIRQRFWQLPEGSSLTVPTPLIYGDLIAATDPRLAEAAADLRESDALLQRLDRG